MKNTSAWKKYNDDERENIFKFAEGYKSFMSDCRTERECCSSIEKEIAEAGYRDLRDLIREGVSLKPGDRVYMTNMGKGMVMFQIGSDPIEDGMNILGAHIDSPRLDLKQHPLYEDTGFAMLDTHYYGGIKKYQWVARPLALHGVVVKEDGTKVEVRIGDDPADPVFGVSDLLIHLAADQMEKKGSVVVEGEDLNILAGSIPLESGEDEEDPVKAGVLKILADKYGITDDDFVSAELEAVPAGRARDYGFDRSMVMSYGHDDRVCAYPSYQAMLALPEVTDRTCACILVDKEEIGSVGATGMQSRFFENTVAEVAAMLGYTSDLSVRRTLAASTMLSSDVSAAFDPNYPSVMDKNNCCYAGNGLVINKYTGVKGKGGSNDAGAEYLARVRKVFDDANVSFQTAELGKVDQGGGGTIAFIMGNYGMEVVDSGVAVLNMHAPAEIISKVDLYEAYRGYIAFLNTMAH